MRLAIKSGVIIPVFLMLPNVAWLLLPNLALVSTGSVPLALTIAENVARVAVLALPFFYTLDLKKKYAPWVGRAWLARLAATGVTRQV